MNEIVLDTSVILKWFGPEEDSDKADSLLQMLFSRQAKMVLPHFVQLEISNILRLGKKFSQEKTEQYILNFFDLRPEFIEIDQNFSLNVVNLCYTHDLTSYDASFIAVSDLWNIPLFTADYKHHKKEVSKNIIWLKEWKGKL